MIEPIGISRSIGSNPGEITDSLNAGRLPADLFALVEQFAGGQFPHSEIEGYAAKASSIVVHQVRGKMIAMIEIAAHR